MLFFLYRVEPHLRPAFWAWALIIVVVNVHDFHMTSSSLAQTAVWTTGFT